MAREIDWTKPISDEDRAWAMQRETLHAQVEANDREFGGNGKPEQTRAERMDALRSVIAESTNELARLEKEQADEDNVNAALAGDPSTGNEIRDNTGVDGEKPSGAPEAPNNYSDWKPDKLKAELKERNKDRTEADLEPLSMTGTKAELIERLLQDDREIAAASAE